MCRTLQAGFGNSARIFRVQALFLQLGRGATFPSISTPPIHFWRVAEMELQILFLQPVEGAELAPFGRQLLQPDPRDERKSFLADGITLQPSPPASPMTFQRLIGTKKLPSLQNMVLTTERKVHGVTFKMAELLYEL